MQHVWRDLSVWIASQDGPKIFYDAGGNLNEHN
jgi:hypothetical protein